MNTLSILVPTHNRADILSQTLKSVQELRIPDAAEVDLVVVANACSDNTEQVVAEAIPSLPMPARCIVEPKAGLSIARNRAIDESTGEICAFIDDDVWLDTGWLDGLLHVFREYPADVVGGKILLWWESVEKPGWWTDRLSSLLSTVDLGAEVKQNPSPWTYVGANFAFRREVFQRIGGFATHLGRIGEGMLSGEETDFVERAFQAGYQGYYAPDAELKHWVPPQRVSYDYLTKAAHGRGYSNVMMKPALNARAWLRAFVGHSWLALYEGARASLDRITGQPDQGLNRQARSSVGWGGLRALWKRTTGNSPAKQKK